MKRFLISICSIICIFVSCEKESSLILNTPSNISIIHQGGSQTISFITNGNWTIVSSEAWCKVSKQSGEGSENNQLVTITCEPNTSYDDRVSILTIKSRNLVETITVTQETNLGLLVSSTHYQLTNEAQKIEIEVMANINFLVEVDASCQNWISQTNTRALSSKIISFSISANNGYSAREGIIRLKQKDGNLSETVRVVQAQTDCILVEKDNYTISEVGGVLNIPVESNVDFTTSLSPDALEWMSIYTIKETDSIVISLVIDDNPYYPEREGIITLSYQSLITVITVKQEGGSVNLSITGDSNCYLISDKGLYRFRVPSPDYDEANNAFLMWNENGVNDIKSIELKNGYVYFEKSSFTPGNALISIAKDSTVIWSWHIWSTEEPQFIDNVMDRNLGATDTQPNSEDTYGLFYSFGCPFPFPGAKYKDWVLTSDPSVPEGWYVASGYGFYAADEMPSPDNPLLLSTNKYKYGNSIYWRQPFRCGPLGVRNLNHKEFQNLLGYEPQFNGLNGVLVKDGLFIPTVYGRGVGHTVFDSERGFYWGNGYYNTTAVSAWGIAFEDGLSHQQELWANGLYCIRSRRY